MTTQVVNIRTLPTNPAEWPADHVYIGRRVRRRGLPASPWANPFGIGGTPRLNRADVIRMFAYWAGGAVWTREHAHELKGKTLVCWCKPAACHGDVLAAMADAS